MGDIQIFSGEEFRIEARNTGGVLEFEIDGVAKSLGFCRIANSGNISIRWERVNKYLEGLSCPQVGTGDFISEEYVYLLAMKSKSDIAIKFQKWLAIEVLPQLRKTGSYDSVENNINKIEDETERGLSIAIYNFEKVIESNPSDFMTGILLQQKKSELESYKQLQQLKLQQEELSKQKEELSTVKETVNLMQEQNNFIADRISFSEKVNILARNYFNKDVGETYRILYSRMKTLGGFDVLRRLDNKREQIQLERLESGKKPYAPSTLKQKITGLDIVEEFDKWELVSEAYKSIETEKFNEKRG